MSTDRDVTRIVRSWLRTDEYESADRVLESVFDALDATPQRRATWWPARRLSNMNNTMRYAVVAAVVAIAAVLGYSYFVAPNVGSEGIDGATPTPEPTASPVALGEFDLHVPLEAGTYGVGDPFAQPFRMTMPADWSLEVLTAGEASFMGSRTTSYPYVGVFIVRRVYADPCHPEGGTQLPLAPPNASEIEAAFRNLEGIEMGTSERVMVALFDKLGDGRVSTAAGLTQQVWVVGPEQDPLLVVAEVTPEGSAEQQAAIDAILSTLSFGP